MSMSGGEPINTGAAAPALVFIGHVVLAGVTFAAVGVTGLIALVLWA